MAPNSVGKSDDQIRKFLRENGVRPTVGNVERVGRELRRTESENERVEKIHREMERAHRLPATVDEKGDVKERVKKIVKRDLDRRQR